MTEDIEHRVRDHLQRLRLPEAPQALRAQLANLAIETKVRQPRRSHRAPLLLFAAAIALSAVVGALVLGGPPDPAPIPTPSPTAVDGILRIVAPGVSLDLPEGWIDHSSLVAVGRVPGQRFIAMLSRGMTPCPNGFYAPAATPSQSCDRESTKAGSALLTIIEYTQPYPGMTLPGPAVKLGAYEGWEREMGTGPVWLVNSPDGGAYIFQVYVPSEDVPRVKPEIRTILGTLRLSSWEASPSAVGGLIHEDAGAFSFDYPAEWVRYYPIDLSMMDAAVVTVASRPVLPPCASDECQRFTTPDATVVIEFRIGGGPTEPDWSDAPLSIGGQPAVRADWGPSNVTDAEESHTWRVRLSDRGQLGIYASLRGPGLPAVTAAMDEVIASIKIDTEPTPAP